MKENIFIKKLLIAILTCGTLVITLPMDVNANVLGESFPVLYGNSDEFDERYIHISRDPQAYIVKEGDTLWKIAEYTLGDPLRYKEILADNIALIQDPDYITAGTELIIVDSGYIRRMRNPEKEKWGMMIKDSFTFDYPYNWKCTFYKSLNTTSGDIVYQMSEANPWVACNMEEKEHQLEDTLSDWNRCKKEIKKFVENEYQGRGSISDLGFEDYLLDNGDKIYLYTFTYEVSVEEEGVIEVLRSDICLGIRLSEHMQIQFLGQCVNGKDYDIKGTVLYMCASFKEIGSGGYVENSFYILPKYEWKLHGVFNAFCWIDQIETDGFARAAYYQNLNEYNEVDFFLHRLGNWEKANG